MRHICWLLIVTASVALGRPAVWGGNRAASEAAFHRLVLAPAVADNLALLFEKFDTELVLCLEGEHRGADLYVTEFRMPHIHLSQTGRVQAASCRSHRRAIGTWHNHPALQLTLASLNPQTLSRNCYLSRTDIDDFQRRKDALVSVVSCGPHTYAYWRRGDVRSVADEVALLPPPPGQLVQSEIWRDRGVTDLTQARKH